MTIQLPNEDEARLAMKAKIAGLDLHAYVERLLKAEMSRPPLDDILKPVQDAFVDRTEGDVVPVVCFRQPFTSLLFAS